MAPIILTSFLGIFTGFFSKVGESIVEAIIPKPNTRIVSVVDSNGLDLTKDPQTSSPTVIFRYQAIRDEQVLNNALFKCKVGNNEFYDCRSPEEQVSNLQPGLHTFQVFAIEANDVEDPTPSTFSVRVLPSVTIIGRLVAGAGDEPLREQRVMLENKANTTTDFTGKFRFENVSKTNQKGTIFDPNGNMLAREIYIEVQPDKPITDIGVIEINSIVPQSPTLSSISNENNTSSTNKAIFIPEPYDTNYAVDLMYEVKPIPPEQLEQLDLLPTSRNVTVWINSAPDTKTHINKVVYYLHYTFNPDVLPRNNAQDNFALRFTIWGGIIIKAKVYFEDNQVQDLYRTIFWINE